MASLNRLYDRLRAPSADAVLDTVPVAAAGFGHLSEHKYCLLVTYRRSGAGVSTPVWFGLADGQLYLRTDAGAAKVKRIANNSRVRVAPCSARGKPLGPPTHGRARVLSDHAEQARAETALRAHYGLGRKLYRQATAARRVPTVYIAVEPAP